MLMSDSKFLALVDHLNSSCSFAARCYCCCWKRGGPYMAMAAVEHMPECTMQLSVAEHDALCPRTHTPSAGHANKEGY